MTSTRVSRTAAIAEKCKDCIYDPGARGAWREQVAACENGGCALHCVRPVPRTCVTGGQIDRAAVAALRQKLIAPRAAHFERA